MRFDVAVRTALLLALVSLIGAGCGKDGDPAPAAPAPDGDPTAAPAGDDALARPDGPESLWMDDRYVVSLVHRAARAGDAESIAALDLPARVSRMRVAVRCLEDTLLHREGSAPDLDALLKVLTALSRAAGGAEALPLTRALPLWSAWTAQEREREALLAGHCVRVLAGIDSFPEAPAEAPGPAPRDEGAAGSPFAPLVPLGRALSMVLAEKRPVEPKGFAAELKSCRQRYEALGWPGGHGMVCERWARRFSAPPFTLSPVRTRLVDEASVSYAQSGDAVREALTLALRARIDRSLADGPLRNESLTNAARLAQQALMRIETVPTRGAERLDVALVAADIAHAAGDFESGAESAARASEWALEDGAPLQARLSAAVIESACRLRTGAFDRAVATAEAAIAVAGADAGARNPTEVRTLATLAQNVAMAQLYAGAYAAAATAFDRAGRLEQASGNAPGAQRAQVQALDAAWRVEEPGERLARVDALVAGQGVSPVVLAEAAWLFLDHRDIERAARLIARFDGAPPRAAGVLRGRLAALRGETEAARAQYAAAERDLVGGRDGRMGLSVARILTAASELEESDGDLASAAWQAYRAVFHLEQTGQPAELHAALCRLIRLERLRLEFGSALANAARRTRLGLAATQPGAALAVHGQLRAQIEAALAVPLDDQQRARVVESCGVAFPEGAERTFACGIARALLLDDAHIAAGLEPPSHDPRFAPLADLAALLARRDELAPARFVAEALALARRMPEDEPEVRRLAVSLALRRLVPADRALEFDPRGATVADGVSPDSLLALLDLRRGLGVASMAGLLATLEDGAVFRVVEPLGVEFLLFTVDSGAATLRRVGGASELPAYRDELADLTSQTPLNRPSWERLLDRARRAREFALEGLDAAHRVTLSIGKPVGPLPLDLGAPGASVGPRIWIAKCAAEVVEAAERTASARLTVLELPDSPLRTRQALTPLALVDPEAQKALVEDVQRRLAAGDSVTDAVDRSRDALRAAWKPAGAPRVPLWAALVLRGAR